MSRATMPFQIEDVEIGSDRPCYVIAELGVNHNGSTDLAKRLIDVAADAGAQAVKLQTFSAERLATPTAAKAEYQRSGLDDHGSQLDMLKSLELDRKAHEMLQRHAREAGLAFLSTPFDEESADLLEDIGVPAFKISSGDLTHSPLLRHIARKGRPVLISTGMASLAEVRRAVEVIRDAGDPPLALFHCVSAYPADPADANLRAIETLRAAFGRPVGWSDHMTDPVVAWSAIALGAELVEKHLTLDHDMPGPDHRASADPGEFRRYVAGIRTVEASLGDGVKKITACEVAIAAVARRSIVTTAPVKAGEIFGAANLAILRPGGGLPPDALERVAGSRAARDLPAGSTISESLISG